MFKRKYTKSLDQWFSTFFTWRHTKHQKKIGGTLITNKTEKNSYILLIATKISSLSTKE